MREERKGIARVKNFRERNSDVCIYMYECAYMERERERERERVQRTQENRNLDFLEGARAFVLGPL